MRLIKYYECVADLKRRELLQRLAAGGALVVTATEIISSPAYADGGTIPCRPTMPAQAANVFTVAVANVNRVDFRLTTTLGTATTCPCGTQPTSTVEYMYSFDSATPSSLVITLTANTSAPITNTWLTTPFDNKVTVRNVTNPMPSPSSWRIRLTIKHKCLDSSGNPTWACHSWYANVSYAGGNATISAQASNSPGPQCSP